MTAVRKSSFCLVLLLVACLPAMLMSAADPDPLTDFTVPGLMGAPTGEDFAKRGINTNMLPSGQGSLVTNANAKEFPGSTGQGISMAFINYAPCGQNPIHNHPRASEMLYVITGQLYVGFIESTNNTLFATNLKAGDVFFFPRGLVHFQQNPNPKKPATAIAALNSQNAAVTRLGTALFGPKGIPTTILQVAFNAEAAAIKVLVEAFPANGNAVGTALPGCGPDAMYLGY